MKFIVLELTASEGGFGALTCLLLDLALSSTFNLKGEIEVGAGPHVIPLIDNLHLGLVGFLNMFLLQKKHLYSYVSVSSRQRILSFCARDFLSFLLLGLDNHPKPLAANSFLASGDCCLCPVQSHHLCQTSLSFLNHFLFSAVLTMSETFISHSDFLQASCSVYLISA